MQKPVYQYNEEGYFLFVTQADESPLEPGKFLYPRNTTDKPPPEHDPERYRAKFNGSNWEVEKIIEQGKNPIDKLVFFLKENPDVFDFLTQAVNDKYYNNQGHPNELSGR